jgi:hypothetical protein
MDKGTSESGEIVNTIMGLGSVSSGSTFPTAKIVYHIQNSGMEDETMAHA